MMSLNSMNFYPAPKPGLAELRNASAERERAMLAFRAKYSAAVALRRRPSAMTAIDQGPERAGAWMDGTTTPANGWLNDPNPNHERIN